MKLKLFFQQTIALVLLFLIGQMAFAQQTFTTVFDNDGKAFRGTYDLIGNGSDRPATLQTVTVDNCPPIIKWARLYWAGHTGGNTDQVVLKGPNGFQKAITSDKGHKETGNLVWNDADYLIYRWRFNDGSDFEGSIHMDTSVSPFTWTAGYCDVTGTTYTSPYAQWSGDNTGTGLEGIMFRVGKIRQDFPGRKIKFNFKAWWWGSRGSGDVAIEVQAYKGGTMQKTGFTWVNVGGTPIGTYTFPQINVRGTGRPCGYHTMDNVGDLEYDPNSGELVWYNNYGFGTNGKYIAGQNDQIDPTQSIVNDGTRVDDDSYYYRWADVTADIQALAAQGNLNGTYQVNNIANGGGASWPIQAGWALIVVYEDPLQTQNMLIEVKNGFERVGAGGDLTRTRNKTGFNKATGKVGIHGSITLGGESAKAGDHFKINGTDISYNGRGSSDFFNGTVTVENATPLISKGWDVSYYRSVVSGMPNTVSHTYEASNGGYDAYINILDAVAVPVTHPSYLMETKILNTSNVDVSDQRIPLNTELKYQIKIRNRGPGRTAGEKLEALLPKNISYIGIESSPNILYTPPTQTVENGQTKLTLNIPSGVLFPEGGEILITIKIKTTNDCNALKDACSNKLDFQPKLIYNTADPIETNKEYLSHKSLFDCKPAPTTFYIEDAPCALVANNTLPYCSAMELDGGAGFTTYSWTKQGQGVVGTSQKYQVTGVGTYILTRTVGTCNQASTITYNIQPRSGSDALHPLRDNSAVTAKEVCNNTGLDYLQIAVCGASVPLTAQVASTVLDNDIIWYKYTGTTSTTASCPPTPIPAARGSWREVGRGRTYNLPETEVETDTNGGTHFGILIKNPGNCEMDYYFGASKSNTPPNLRIGKRNIMPLICTPGGTPTNKGWFNLSGIPDTNYQYKVDGPSNSVNWTDVPGQSFSKEVTAAGHYTVTIRKKLPNGGSQYQGNVCGFEKSIDIQATTAGDTDANFTLTKKDILCVSNNPSGGKLKVVLSNDVTLPVKVIVERRGTPNTLVTQYEATTEADRNSESTSSATILAALTKGTYEVKLQVGDSSNSCTSPVRSVEIKEENELKLLSAATEVPTCGPNKKITITYQGGKPPYTVWVETSGVLQRPNVGNATSYTFDINDPNFKAGDGHKIYMVGVIDANGCSAFTHVRYEQQPRPTFTKSATAADCSANGGTITMSINNALFDPTKYDVKYAIQKKVGTSYPATDTWVRQDYPNGTFRGLTTGTYRLRVYYSRGSKTCSYPEESYQVLNSQGQLEYLRGTDYDDQEIDVVEGTPLQAFVNISHLACKDAAGNGVNPTGVTPPYTPASIRISNLFGGNGTGGGVGPGNKYEVSLDGGTTWNGNALGATWLPNELRFDGVKPGTYTVMVRSKNPPTGVEPCSLSFDMNVEPPLAEPEIRHTVAYDCSGAARVTYTTDRADYSYHIEKAATVSALPAQYTGTYDRVGTIGVEDFTVSDAGTTQATRIFYKKTLSDKRELIREDFGTGNATDIAGLNRTGVSVSPGLSYVYPCAGWNQYMIVNNAEFDAMSYRWSSPCRRLGVGGWIQSAPVDHTTNDPASKGRFMYIDMGTNLGQGETLYQKVVDIVPNGPIGFEIYVMNLNTGEWGVKPDIRIQITDLANNVIAQTRAVEIPFNSVNGNTNWVRVSSDELGDIDPGNRDKVIVKIQNTKNDTGGNDFAIDDIYVFQGPVFCPTRYKDVTVDIASGKELKMTNPVIEDESCYGANDGKVSTKVSNFGQSYYWYLTYQGSTTRLREYTEMTEDVNIRNLAPARYTLHIKAMDGARFSDRVYCDISKDFEVKRSPQLVVTQNKTEDYLNCDVDRAYVVIFGQNGSRQNDSTLNPIFNLSGGKQEATGYLKYTIKVTDGNNITTTVTPTNGIYRYSFAAGTYKISISDENECNKDVVYTFVMKARNKLQKIDLSYVGNGATCVNNSSTGIGKIVITPTWVTTDNGQPLRYAWKKKSDTNWTNLSSNEVPAATVAFWDKGVEYVIRARDSYICGQEKTVVIHPEIRTLTSGDYEVVQPQNCGSTPTTTGKITVNNVSGGASSSYEYAIVAAGGTPGTYQTSNVFTGLAAGKYDIYIKDATPGLEPEPCGKKVASNIAIHNSIASSITGSSAISTAKSAYCEDNGGTLVFNTITGKGPFKITLVHGGSSTTTVHTIARTPAIQPGDTSVPAMTVNNYEITGLASGTYTITVTDEGNGGCNITPGGTSTATINPMTWGATPSKRYANYTCGASTRDFSVKFTHDATPASDYKLVYRIIKKDGVAYSKPWITETAAPPTPLLANSAVFSGEGINHTYVVEAALVKATETNYSGANLLCKTTTEVRLQPSSNDLTTANATALPCAGDYTVNAKLGTAGTYYDVQFLVNKTANGGVTTATATQSAVIGTYAGGTPVNFTLKRGRNNEIFVNYKTSPSGPVCTLSVTPQVPATPPTLEASAQGDNVINLCSSAPGSPVELKINVTTGTPTSFVLYKKGSDGTLTSLGTTTSWTTAASVPPAPTGTVYSFSITPSPSLTTTTTLVVGMLSGTCESQTNEVVVSPPASPMVAGTINVEDSSKAISCTDGKGQLVISGMATGGVGPYTFSFDKSANATNLRRTIRVRNVTSPNAPITFDFKESDFLVSLPTMPALTLTIKDEGTGCTLNTTIPAANMKHFANSKHTAKFQLDIDTAAASACDNSNDTYTLKITLSALNAVGSHATFADYEYSIDGGATYTQFPANPATVAIPAYFDHTKVKVRNRHSKCTTEAPENAGHILSLAPNEKLAYPKLRFTANKTQDIACDAGGVYRAKLKAVITSGSDFVTAPTVPSSFAAALRYEIKVTEVNQGDSYTTPLAAPMGTLVSSYSPAGTNAHEQEIDLPLPVGGSKRYFVVWIKDTGSRCTDYRPSQTIEILPAETQTDLKTRHEIDRAEIKQVENCDATPTGGSFEFIRKTSANAREDVAFVYDLQKATPIGSTTFVSVKDITDLDRIPSKPTDPAGSVRYRVEGLAGNSDYKLFVKSSSNGVCGGYNVTNDPLNVVSIFQNPYIKPDPSDTNGGALLVDRSCSTTAIDGVTPSPDHAKLRVKIAGGIPPYTIEVLDGSNAVLQREVKNQPLVTYPTPSNYSESHIFELPDTGFDYPIKVKITDGKGCVIDDTNYPAFAKTVKTLHKIDSVSVTRTQRMSCATGAVEKIKFEVHTHGNVANTNGYNLHIEQRGSLGSYTDVGIYLQGERPVADIPGTGLSADISLPNITTDEAEYRITVLDKDTKCTYVLPEHYKVIKSVKPRVTLSLVEGGCADIDGSAPNVDLKFKIEVEGGDYEQNGYTYQLSTVGPGYTSGLSTATTEPSVEFPVSISNSLAANGSTTRFQVEVKVVDSQCEAIAETTVVRPSMINVTTAMTKGLTYCNGVPNNDAEIAVTGTPTGGWGGPYLYQIVSNGAEGGWTNETTFGGLGEGSHYIQVRDGRGCVRNLDTYRFLQYNNALMDLQPPTSTPTVTPSCVGAQDGSLRLVGVSGGMVPAGTPHPDGGTAAELKGRLSYELFDAETNTSLGVILPDDNATTRGTVTFRNIGSGKYFVRIYSALLCADDYIDTDPIIVKDPGTILARARITKQPGCATAGDLLVEVDPRPGMESARDTYVAEIFDVTDENNPVSLGSTAPSDITGGGIAGATIRFQAKLKAQNNGGNVDRKYRVTVKDNNGSGNYCSGKSNIVPVSKVAPLTITHVAEESVQTLKCYQASYGKITVRATGGKADEQYTFTLKKGSATVASNNQGVFEGLSAGTYKAEVTQANGGCGIVSTGDIVITEETPFKVKFKVEDVKCNGEKDGKITITHTDGLNYLSGTRRKLTYAISPRLDRFLEKPNGVIDSLAPGRYFVIVQDENGCRPHEIYKDGETTPIADDVIEFIVNEPEPLSVTVNPEFTLHESCEGSSDGEARLRVYGGVPYSEVSDNKEYKISIDGGAFIPYFTLGVGGGDPNGTKLENLSAGDHTIVVKDKNEKCLAETSVRIEKGSEVKLHLSEGKYECVDGVIKYVVEASVTPTNLALNVRYALERENSNVFEAHDNAKFNLDVDLRGNTTKTYKIRVYHKVTGHKECYQTSDPITVAPKSPITIDDVPNVPKVKCHDSADASFVITAHGGSEDFEYGMKKADGTYQWQGTNNVFSNLKVGSYTVAVKDNQYGCIVEKINIPVEAPQRISITQQAIQHVGCKGETNGKITYVLDGGNSPYNWELFKEDGTSTSKRGQRVRVATPFDITGLAAGKYMLLVTDSNDCKERKNFEIIEGVDLAGVITQQYQCNSVIDENNKVLVVAGARGVNSDTAAEATYDVYVSVTTPYLVINPSIHGAANRLRYAIGVEGGSLPTQRYEFEGTSSVGGDNTHNMYRIKHATLVNQLNTARALQEGLNRYKLYLYYFDKDFPRMSDLPLCQDIRDLNIEYYPPLKITNTSVANDLNLLKVKIEGGKQKYTVYFSSAQYHTAEEAKAHYVQRVDNVPAGEEVTYYVQRTDYEEENPDTGKVEKKVRVYVEDSKGELNKENGGKEACGHSVFLYKEFVDVEVPNFFTPNGDGQYDTWAPLNLASYPNAEVVIYDRYGRHIATLNNKQEWDGTYGGEALPTGDYWYVLRLNEPDDNRTFKGHFTLYR